MVVIDHDRANKTVCKHATNQQHITQRTERLEHSHEQGKLVIENANGTVYTNTMNQQQLQHMQETKGQQLQCKTTFTTKEQELG